MEEQLSVLFRLILAFVIGGLIGWEREQSRHPAGIRTHILVCLGAAIVMLISEDLSAVGAAGGVSSDPARLGAGVLSGIGFLGAGTIMKEGYAVTGLTTAASLWVVACLGLAAGAGEYLLAVAGLVLVVGVLHVSEFNRRRQHHGGPVRTIRVDCVAAARPGVVSEISQLLVPHHAELCRSHVIELENGEEVRLTFDLRFDPAYPALGLSELISLLGTLQTLRNVELSYSA